MSESQEHKNLVIATARMIRWKYPNMLIKADVQDFPRTPTPPMIGGYRPDIFAYTPFPDNDVIIAEAKTLNDIDNSHTLNQTKAFIKHLQQCHQGVGTFILSVYGDMACKRARNFLHYTFQEQVSARVNVQLYDGFDSWSLGRPQEKLWHLS